MTTKSKKKLSLSKETLKNLKVQTHIKTGQPKAGGSGLLPETECYGCQPIDCDGGPTSGR